MKTVLKAFRALSDETRLRVLNLVLERECCVCEVMQALDISQSKASRALCSLYDAGFLKLRKDGLWSFYSMDDISSRAFMNGLSKTVQTALKDSLKAELDKERLKKVIRNGPGCLTVNYEPKDNVGSG